MNKYILTVAAAAFAIGLAQADYTSLYVNTNEGASVEIRFDECPVATFEEETLVITDDSEQRLEFPMVDIKNITFKTVSGVDDVKIADITISITTESILVEGLGEGQQMRLFDVAGTPVSLAVADSNGHASADISKLNKGIYVVSMPGRSFKFIK